MGSDVDDHHGDQVPDPYRWLETTSDPETASWIAAQNEVTESFLAAVPAREPIRAQVTAMSNYPKLTVPFERGGRWFQFRNSGLDAQPVLYLLDEPGGSGHPLLDPNTLSPDGTTAVSSADVTDDGSLLAYAASDGGSDWMTWRIRDVATGRDLDDVIEWSKFCRAAWRADRSGFYYCSMQPTAVGAEYLESNVPGRIFLHRLGKPQADDELVFSAPHEPDWIPYAEVSDDGRFLVVTVEKGSVFENQLLVLDLRDPEGTWSALIGDFESSNQVVSNAGETFYLVTDYGAERKRLVAVDLDQPDREYWREIIGEATGDVGECLLLRWPFRLPLPQGRSLRAASARHRRQPCSRHPVAWQCLPIPRPAAELGARGTFAVRPHALRHHDLHRPGLDLVAPVVHEQDGDHRAGGGCHRSGQLPHRTGLHRVSGRHQGADVPDQAPGPEADGQAPAMLYAYGGFDVSITPSFSPQMATWLERGGVLAVANLRGGGEYGRAWHNAGRRAAKQNVFDDFCACAALAGLVGLVEP